MEGRGHCFNDPACGTLAIRLPVLEYPTSSGCAVTGGFVYRGAARADERGRYVYGDYCSGIVWSFRIAEGAATDLRVEPFRVESLTSFGEDVNGELYLADLAGTVYRIDPR